MNDASSPWWTDAMTALSEASKQAALVAVSQTSIGSMFATEYIRISNAATALMRDFTKVTVFAGENSEPTRVDQESIKRFLKMRGEISDSKPLGHFPETSALSNATLEDSVGVTEK